MNKNILVTLLILSTALSSCSHISKTKDQADLLNEIEAIVLENHEAYQTYDLDRLKKTIHPESILLHNVILYWECIKEDNFSAELKSLSITKIENDILVARALHKIKEWHRESENQLLIVFKQYDSEWMIWSFVSLEPPNTIKGRNRVRGSF